MVEYLLIETDSISREEVKAANSLIKEYYDRKRLRFSGPCLNCLTGPIDYGELCPTHKAKGNDWLDSLFNKWQRPPTIERETSSYYYARLPWSVNNLRPETYAPYFCERCIEELDMILADMDEQHAAKTQEEKARQSERNDAIIRGEIRSTPAKRFHILRPNEDDIEALRQLPYRAFLTTCYWDVVRDYVLWKRGYACELCNHQSNLHIHHKTYEHHGREHQNLTDLIILCSSCHAKFHDKLAKEAV
jgi:5-methylcytosine-specific restriction endonuclease McrA